jgi:predicted nuclease of restriction endonuclease-like (RecB) superfamily
MEKQYIEFIADLKTNIIQSRYIAARLANKEQLMLYFQTGKMLAEKIESEKWGGKVIEKIAQDLQIQLPGLRGFSHTNLKNMRQFFEVYRNAPIGQSPTGQIDPPGTPREKQSFTDAFWGVSFTHHILLFNKCKSLEEREFYIKHAASQCWSVNTLEYNLKAGLFHHQGNLPNNFKTTLPGDRGSGALQVFKDEYLFDFVTLDDIDERVLEDQLVTNVKNMIMSLGKGFTFLGNQYRLEVANEEFFIDLLFFNRHLQCLVAFELKRGKFKPEYAGQLNFYLNVLDDKIKLPHENPSIGIILCKEKTNTIVEFSIRNIDKAMGVATYRTTNEVPKEMKGILPDTAELVKLL